MASGWRRRAALPVVCSLAACFFLAACGLNFDRYDPGPDAAAVLDGGRDASTADHEAEAEAAAAAVDAPAPDVGQDTSVSACKPAPGVLVAAQTPGPITIDGDLGDWGSTAFTLLDAADAALIMGPNGTCSTAMATSQCLVPAGEAAEIAFLYDSDSLYFGVRVTVAGVGGGSTSAPYTNDAIEIYLRGDATATGNYTGVDHQYVIDWQNLVLDYGPSPTDIGMTNPPGLTSAVQVAGNTNSYVLEVKVALGELGQTALVPGQMLGLDLGVDHGQGTDATRSLLVWWMAAHAAPTCTTAKCTGCNPDQPYCDTLTFGLLCAD